MATLVGTSTINSPSGRGKDALGIILQNSAFLRALEKYSGWELDATSYLFAPVTATSTAPARALGSAFSDGTRTFPSNQSGTLAVHGDSVTTDISYLQDAARGLRDKDTTLNKDIQRRLIAFSKAYEALLFTGSGADSNIKGLRTILDGTTTIPGFTSTYRYKSATDVAGSADSLDLSTSANQKKFLELLKTQKLDVENATMVAMNSSLWARVETAAFDLRLARETTDQFGQDVVKFAGMELVIVGDTAITLTEDDTASTPVAETTSCYIMAPAEMNLSLVTNSGLYWMDWDHQDNTQKGRETWEIRSQWKIENAKAIKRIAHIKVG